MTLGNDNGTDGQTDRQTDRQTDGQTECDAICGPLKGGGPHHNILAKIYTHEGRLGRYD